MSFDYTPLQQKINSLCREMDTVAPIPLLEYKSSEQERKVHRRETFNKMKLSYGLWQKAIPLLQGQPFTHFLFTYGYRNIKKKPRKQNMHSCTFSSKIPKLCFLMRNKGEYYELEMRFKAGTKTYSPHEFNPTFFIHAKSEPYRFYLLDSITDYQVTSFFAKSDFKLLVLKCHYHSHFKAFTDQLAKFYELKTKGIE